MYVMGKGSTLVPVFVPCFCTHAIDLLCRLNIRAVARVDAGNKFLFPYTSLSDDCTIGYIEIRDLCLLLDIPIITPTAVHHRAATRLWEGSSNSAARSSVIEHMGHREDINKNIHACPPTGRLLSEVTPFLGGLNQVCNNTLEVLHLSRQKRCSWPGYFCMLLCCK